MAYEVISGLGLTIDEQLAQTYGPNISAPSTTPNVDPDYKGPMPASFLNQTFLSVIQKKAPEPIRLTIMPTAPTLIEDAPVVPPAITPAIVAPDDSIPTWAIAAGVGVLALGLGAIVFVMRKKNQES
jgi:LPXTG-motif cell wall-anchored protein